MGRAYKNNVSELTVEKLGYYVYLLIDPRKQSENAGVFYVGKGFRKRAQDHLNDFKTKESEKIERINEIREYTGKEPRIDILRHGLTSDEAFEIEGAVIDYIGKENLTNKVLGHDSSDRGRMSLEELEIKYHAEKVKFEDDLLLININKSFNRKMNSDEILEVTKGNWTIRKERAVNFKIACAVFRGIIREVFEIVEWFDAPQEHRGSKPRIFFEGIVANKELRSRYLYRDVSNYKCQFPIRYIEKCKCDDHQCAKCLTVNCEDDSCSVHTMKNKEKRREYFGIKRNNSTGE